MEMVYSIINILVSNLVSSKSIKEFPYSKQYILVLGQVFCIHMMEQLFNKWCKQVLMMGICKL